MICANCSSDVARDRALTLTLNGATPLSSGLAVPVTLDAAARY
jgi:hypothetical protein